jgi:hypothetical protein
MSVVSGAFLFAIPGEKILQSILTYLVLGRDVSFAGTLVFIAKFGGSILVAEALWGRLLFAILCAKWVAKLERPTPLKLLGLYLVCSLAPLLYIPFLSSTAQVLIVGNGVFAKPITYELIACVITGYFWSRYVSRRLPARS